MACTRSHPEAVSPNVFQANRTNSSLSTSQYLLGKRNCQRFHGQFLNVMLDCVRDIGIWLACVADNTLVEQTNVPRRAIRRPQRFPKLSQYFSNDNSGS